MRDVNARELGEELKKEENKKYMLLAIFVAALIGLFVLTRFMPDFSLDERDKIFRVPKSPMDLYNITKVLEKYTQAYPYYVLFAFVYLYILLQAFAIPGPIFLCILAGPLFGHVQGFFLALSVRHQLIIVLRARCLLLLLPQLYSWAVAGLQVLPRPDGEAEEHGEPPSAQPVLVHAVPEADPAGSELVRKSGFPVGGYALSVLLLRELHRPDSQQLHPAADGYDAEGD